MFAMYRKHLFDFNKKKKENIYIMEKEKKSEGWTKTRLGGDMVW